MKEISLTSFLERKELREILLIFAFLFATSTFLMMKGLVKCVMLSGISGLFNISVVATMNDKITIPSPPSFKGRR